MSYDKFMASFEKLDRDMTHCEKLAKLIGEKGGNGKLVQKSKSDAMKKTTIPGHLRATSSRRSAPEGIGVVKKTAETSTKPKTIENGPRKRVPGDFREPSETCKCPSVLRTRSSRPPVRPPHAPNASLPPPPPKFRDEKPRSKSPTKHKHLSWGEVLAQNHKDSKPYSYDSKAPRSRSTSSVAINVPFSTKHPHDCTGPAPHKHGDHDRIVYDVPSRVRHPSSLSGEESSGFSSNTEPPITASSKCKCGVQRGSPPLTQKVRGKSHKTSSTSSGASCQMEDEDDEGKGLLASEAYAVFNPVRTLNFLMRELHGRLLKAPKEDQNAHRIVAEMQKLLQRLPEDSVPDTPGLQSQGSKHSHLSGSTHSLDSAQGSLQTQTGKRPLGINQVEKHIVEQTLASCPNLAKKIEENTRSLCKKIAEVNPLMPLPLVPEVALSTQENAQFYQRYMEVSCEQLGIMTTAMEKTCDHLKKEKEDLENLLREKEEEMKKLKAREKDYVTAVNTLRQNFETLTEKEEHLIVENRKLKEEAKKLKEEIKELPALRTAQSQVSSLQDEIEKLREENKLLPGLKFIEDKYQAAVAVNGSLAAENKRLQATLEACRRQKGAYRESCAHCLRMEREVQTLKLEREKLFILIRSKDSELQHYQKEAQNIHRLVDEQLILLRDDGRGVAYSPSPPASLDFFSSSGSGSGSASASGSEQEEEQGATGKSTPATHPICSSPNASNFKAVDDNWENMSTILPEAVHSSPDVHISLPTKNTSEDTVTFHSLDADREPWRKENVDTQGDASSTESRLQRQRMSVQRSQEWLQEQGAVAHSDGVGSDGSGDQHVNNTKDLRKTLHQLLKLVQKQQQHQQQSKKALHSKREPPLKPAADASGASGASGRVLHVEMPVLPSPPKFLDPPEFSDFSSLADSHPDLRSLETDNLTLEDDGKKRHKKK